MKKKSLILICITLCFAILLSACGKKPVDEAVNNKVTASTPEVKTETPKEEPKKEEPKKEEVKQEVKQDVKKEAPKQTSAATNKVTTNTSKPAEQPKQTVAPATTTTTPEPPQTPVIKDEFQIAMENAIPNNGRYKVTFDKTSGPIPYGLTFYIENINSEKEKNSIIKGYVVSENKMIATNSGTNDFIGSDKFKGFLSIPGSNTVRTSVDCYIIIPSKEDGKTYYEKMTYTITK